MLQATNGAAVLSLTPDVGSWMGGTIITIYKVLVDGKECVVDDTITESTRLVCKTLAADLPSSIETQERTYDA
jgi:hypothetical protein